MKIFISWSGSRSKSIAEKLQEFLKSCIHESEPFFSHEDIQKGAKWFETISVQLAQTNFGIICLTKENRASPWILFEAGALAKNLQMANVCPILFGLGHNDIEGPLSQFQLTAFRRDEMYKLCLTINSRLNRGLEERTLRRSFEALWAETEEEIIKIIDDADPFLQVSGRSSREILEDIWQQLRLIHYPESYALDDKFVLKMMESLQVHASVLKDISCNKGFETLRTLLVPIEHFIARVHDKQTRELLAQKYMQVSSIISV